MKIYIGTYTEGFLSDRDTGSKGIYSCEFDEKSGKISILDGTMCRNPSFVTLSPDKKVLLAVNEAGFDGGLDTYEVGEDGKLSHIEHRAIGGAACCHVGFSPDGKFITGTNYNNGSFFTIEMDGGRFLKTNTDIQYEGHGVDKERQEGPHAHSARILEKLGILLVCDLGTDRIMFYRYGADGKVSEYEKQPYIKTRPGFGPRHTEVLCDGRLLYVTGELSSEVAVYEFSEENGTFAEKQLISMLPEELAHKNGAADIHFDEKKENLYASNRGHESIVQYKLEDDGTLRLIGWYSCGGITPRNFAVAGGYLICANQDSDNVTVYRLNADGSMGEFTEDIRIPSPVCILPMK